MQSGIWSLQNWFLCCLEKTFKCVMTCCYLSHKMCMLEPNTQWDGVRRRGLGQVTGSWGCSLMNRVGVPGKGGPASLTFSARKTQWEGRCLRTRKWVLSGPTLNLPAPWPWTSQPPELEATDFCCLWASQPLVFWQSGRKGPRPWIVFKT